MNPANPLNVEEFLNQMEGKLGLQPQPKSTGDVNSFLAQMEEKLGVTEAQPVRLKQRGFVDSMMRAAGPMNIPVPSYEVEAKPNVKFAPTAMGRIGEAATSGAAGVTHSLGGFAESTGMPGVQQAGVAMQDFAKPAVKPTRGVEDVDWTSLGDIGSFVAESIAEQAPQLVTVIGAGLAGAGAAGLAAPSATAATLGMAGAAGAAVMGYFQEAGSTFTNLREMGVPFEKAAVSAHLAGAGKSVLEAYVPVKMMGAVKWLPTAKVMARPMLAKAIGMGMLEEGGTETTQEAVDVLAEFMNDVGDQSPAAVAMRLVNSGVKGAITGGGMGLVSGLAGHDEPSDGTPPLEISGDIPVDPRAPTTSVVDKKKTIELPTSAESQDLYITSVATKLQKQPPEFYDTPLKPSEVRKALGYKAGQPLADLVGEGALLKGAGGYFFTPAVVTKVRELQNAALDEFTALPPTSSEAPVQTEVPPVEPQPTPVIQPAPVALPPQGEQFSNLTYGMEPQATEVVQPTPPVEVAQVTTPAPPPTALVPTTGQVWTKGDKQYQVVEVNTSATKPIVKYKGPDNVVRVMPLDAFATKMKAPTAVAEGAPPVFAPVPDKVTKSQPLSGVNDGVKALMALPDPTPFMDAEAAGQYAMLQKQSVDPSVTLDQRMFALRQMYDAKRAAVGMKEGDRLKWSPGEQKYQLVTKPLLGFYSAVERAIASEKFPEVATGAQVMGMLKNSPGVNQAELVWLGFDDLGPGKKYTKAELMDLGSQNGIRMEVATLPSREESSFSVVNYFIPGTRTQEDFEGIFRRRNLVTGEDQLAAVGEARRSLLTNAAPSSPAARDILELPYSIDDKLEVTANILSYFSNRVNTVPTQYGGRLGGVSLITPGPYTNYQETLLFDDNLPVPYEPPHFSGASPRNNMVAHLRTTEREVDGTPTLMVDEMQSDLAAGMRDAGVEKSPKRKLGASSPEITAWHDAVRILDNQVYSVRGFTEEGGRDYDSWESPEHARRFTQEFNTLGEQAVKLGLIGDFVERTTPFSSPMAFSDVRWEVFGDAMTFIENDLANGTQALSPFFRPQDWIRLTFRRAMQMAVEKGKEMIAIPQGQEQKRRYPYAGQGLVNLYDRTIRNEVAALVKKLGGEVQTMVWDTGKETENPVSETDIKEYERRIRAGVQALAEPGTQTDFQYNSALLDLVHLHLLTVTEAGHWRTMAQQHPEQRSAIEEQLVQLLYDNKEKETIKVPIYAIHITQKMKDVVMQGQPLFRLQDGMPQTINPITQADVERAFPGQQIVAEEEGWKVILKNGATVWVQPNVDIVVNPAIAARDWPGMEGVATGHWVRLSLGGLIELSGLADFGTLSHEVFHAAMGLALNEQERARVLAAYKTEERAADAYAAWAGEGSAPHSLFKKIMQYFRGLLGKLFGRSTVSLRAAVEQDIFSKIGDGTAWAQHGDFPAWTAEEQMARQAQPHGDWLPSHDASDLSPAQAKVDARMADLFRNVPKEQHYQLRKDIGKWFRFGRYGITLLQLRDVFKNYAPLLKYIDATRLYWRLKNEVLIPAHEIIQNQWIKLDKKSAAKLDKLLYHIAELSHRQEKRLGRAEILTEARKLGAATQDVLDVYFAVDKAFHDGLKQLWASMDKHLAATSPDPIVTALNRKRLAKEFGALVERNYFPFTRFGKFGVRVRATKGFTDNEGKYHRKNSLVTLLTEDAQWKAEATLKHAHEAWSKFPVQISSTYLYDEEHSLMGLPPMLQDALVGNLGLTEQQKIEMHELTYHLAPGHAYVKHLMKKTAVPGYTADAMRTFANYFQHLSNHIARLETRVAMDKARAEVAKDTKTQTAGRSYGLLYETMSQHQSYLYNPGNEMGVIRGAMFLWYFGGVPIQALVNLTQLPVFAYSYLAKRHGDARTTATMVKALKDGGVYLTGKTAGIGQERLDALQWGKESGTLTEYMAAEVAGMADGGMFSGKVSPRLEHKVKQLVQTSSILFKWSETYNRYVTFLTAYDLARKEGKTIDAARVAAREAVDETMFEYARWNRVPMARGKMAPILIFKTYMQHALVFMGTNKGGWRFWVMMALMGGLKAMPGFEDLSEWLNWAITKVREQLGLKDPQFDLEREARKLATEIGMNPDLFMNGVMRYGPGLLPTEWAFGLPMPMIDLSAKVQLGRIVPGAAGLAQTLQGKIDWKTWALQTVQETLGATSNVGFNFTKALLDPRTPWWYAGPSVMKSIVRAADILYSGGFRDAQGNMLVPFNKDNPGHMAEVVGQIAGAASTRVRQTQEARQMSMEHLQYITTRRETLLGRMGLAADAEERKEVIEDIKRFNASVEGPDKLTGEQIRASLNARIRNRKLRERGYPTVLKYKNLFQSDRGLFRSPMELELMEQPAPDR